MTVDIDHERICETEDRSWTFDLLDQVRSSSVADADRSEALRTLGYLEDYRSIAPLTAIVEDREQSELVRTSASEVLAGFDDSTTGERRRGWWHGGDPVLQAHALRLMGRSEADVVVAVAGDDAHGLQAVALDAMAFGYDEASFPPVVVRALRHPSAAVRATAADVLLWDEPVAAETPLLDAACDSSAAVAAAAVNTLQYYPSRRVLRALAELTETGDDEVRAKAVESLEYNRGRFESCGASGDPSQLAELREWMAPVSDLVGPPDDAAPRGSSSPRSVRDGVVLSERDLLALLSDADGEWAAKNQTLRSLSWTSYRDGERGRLCRTLTTHADPVVREIAATALAAWSKTAELLELASDPHAGVRKSAIYHLRLVPPDRAVGAAAWNSMLGRGGTIAQEALQTYVVHAPAGEAKTRLTELARTDRRESIRTTAVSGLIGLEAAPEIESLSPLLREPPGVSWAVHIGLIDGLRALAVPAPALDGLALIDNLDLVESVVALRHS